MAIRVGAGEDGYGVWCGSARGIVLNYDKLSVALVRRQIGVESVFQPACLHNSFVCAERSVTASVRFAVTDKRAIQNNETRVRQAFRAAELQNPDLKCRVHERPDAFAVSRSALSIDLDLVACRVERNFGISREAPSVQHALDVRCERQTRSPRKSDDRSRLVPRRLKAIKHAPMFLKLSHTLNEASTGPQRFAGIGDELKPLPRLGFCGKADLDFLLQFTDTREQAVAHIVSGRNLLRQLSQGRLEFALLPVDLG